MFSMSLLSLLVNAFSPCVTVKLQVADNQGFKYEGPQADLTSVATAFLFSHLLICNQSPLFDFIFSFCICNYIKTQATNKQNE